MHFSVITADKTFVETIGDATITIGDGKTTTDFKPHIKAEFWNGEDNFTLEIPNTTAIPILKNDKVSVEKPTRGMDWLKDGNELKWLFRFKSKPDTNKYSMQLGGGWQQFKFNYQLPLENVNIYTKNGEEWLNGNHPGRLEKVMDRPRKVDGSYSVTHKTKRDHIEGQTNYKTGKVCHIYVPKATDVDGKFVWCTLHIENGTYTVTIPQKFLDEAVYPVVINDTFGWTGIGGSSFDLSNAAGTKGTMVVDGTVTKVSAYCVIDSGTPSLKGLIYTIDGGDDSFALVKFVGNAVAAPAGAAWVDSIGSQVLTAATYYVGVVPSGARINLYQDAEGGWESWFNIAVTYASPENNPAGGSEDDGFRYSVYATYTPTPVGAAGIMTTNTGYWGPTF